MYVFLSSPEPSSDEIEEMYVWAYFPRLCFLKLFDSGNSGVFNNY